MKGDLETALMRPWGTGAGGHSLRLDSRGSGNDPPEADREFERCQSRSPTDQVRGRLHPLPSGETELHNGCAEGQSPFAEVLGVSPSFLFSPKSGG